MVAFRNYNGTHETMFRNYVTFLKTALISKLSIVDKYFSIMNNDITTHEVFFFFV